MIDTRSRGSSYVFFLVNDRLCPESPDSDNATLNFDPFQPLGFRCSLPLDIFSWSRYR
jgi:hypothetical protein